MNMTLNLEARKQIYLAYVATSRKTNIVPLGVALTKFKVFWKYTGNIKYHVQRVKLEISQQKESKIIQKLHCYLSQQEAIDNSGVISTKRPLGSFPFSKTLGVTNQHCIHHLELFRIILVGSSYHGQISILTRCCRGQGSIKVYQQRISIAERIQELLRSICLK